MSRVSYAPLWGDHLGQASLPVRLLTAPLLLWELMFYSSR